MSGLQTNYLAFIILASNLAYQFCFNLRGAHGIGPTESLRCLCQKAPDSCRVAHGQGATRRGLFRVGACAASKAEHLRVPLFREAIIFTAGTSITFTTTPANGGEKPVYRWKVNGSNAGSNSSTFTTSTLANGDLVTRVLTSDANCSIGSPATKNELAITVNSAPVLAAIGNNSINKL